MVQKSLIKLIDEAVIPAVGLISAKTIGLFLIAYLLNLEFTVKANDFLGLLPSVQFADAHDYIKAENYSNAAMFAFAALGTLFVLVRAHFFHESHVHPRTQIKLAALSLEKLIAPSYHLYHQAMVWLTFLWLTVGFLAISTALNITYVQISFVAFIVAANFSWVFALDVEKEIQVTTSRI